MTDGRTQPHRHPKQPDIEDFAFDDHQLLAQAVEELLIEKGLFGPADVRKMTETLFAKSPADGARLVARAWLDPAFEKLMLQSVNAAAAALGIDAGDTPIVALGNTARVHNVIVCTLCSCYPRLLLGISPDWYRSRAYRSRVVREPRAVLAEFGLVLLDSVEVRVHDSTAERRYMVHPMRPLGTEHLSEAALAALVTRDCMIGTAVPEHPRPAGRG